jgi:cytochrome c oxidase subunit 1
MFNAHIGFDVLIHDTFYVVGHFHVMLAGAATSCIFAAFYFYFSAIFGVAYVEVLAYLHFILYFCGHIMTVVPMLWAGYAGMPRRIMDYPEYFGGWQSIASGGHVLSIVAFLCFLLMLLLSLCEGRAAQSYSSGIPRLNTRLAFYGLQRSRRGVWGR